MWNRLQQARFWVMAGQPVGIAPAPDYLTQRDFLMTIAAAFMLHLMALYIWYISPKTQVIDIPVRALNIKLGGDDITPEELKAAQPDAANKNDVEHTISHLVRDQDPAEQARVQSVANSMDKAVAGVTKALKTPAPTRSHAVVKGTFDRREEGVSTAAPVMPVMAHQYVRENSINATAAGNSVHDAEIVSRYEQSVSLWIEKFKTYPEEARAQKLEGDTMMRVRIDRHGNITYYILEYSTGYRELDRAAIDMVKRANPVPAAPADYPQSDLIEFLIPVKFHLQ